MVAVAAEVAALMMDRAHPGGIGVDAARAIFHHRVVPPTALPQLVADLDVLFGNVIALVMRQQLGLAEAARGAVEVRRYDIPRDTPLRQMIERRNQPRKDKRMVLQGRAGKGEAEML